MMNIDLVKRASADGAQISVDHADDESIHHVFPLRFSHEYLLCFDERELALDGYVVFPIEHITGMERTKFDDFRSRMMRDDGALERLHAPDGIDISSPFGLFSWIRTNRLVITMNVTDDRFPDDDPKFQIGPVTDVDRDGFTLHWFSADGDWAEEPYRFLFHEVRSLGFLGNYESVYQRRLMPRPAAMKPRKVRDSLPIRRRTR